MSVMLEYFMSFILLLVFSIPTGMAARAMRQIAPDLLGYGGIFWKYRRWVIRRRLDINKKNEFDTAFNAAIESGFQYENTEAVYEYYKTFWSSWVLCEKCIGLRILLLLCLTSIIILQLPFYIYPIYLIFSFIGYQIDKQ